MAKRDRGHKRRKGRKGPRTNDIKDCIYECSSLMSIRPLSLVLYVLFVVYVPCPFLSLLVIGVSCKEILIKRAGTGTGSNNPVASI